MVLILGATENEIKLKEPAELVDIQEDAEANSVKVLERYLVVLPEVFLAEERKNLPSFRMKMMMTLLQGKLFLMLSKLGWP